MQTSGHLEVLGRNRRQAVSTAGLGVIFAAVLASFGQGLVSPLGLAAACLPPFLAGLLIAASREWVAMAAVAVTGGLGALLLAGQAGADGTTLLVGLTLLLIGSSLLHLRRPWLLPAALASGGAFLLLGVWQVRGVLSPSALLLAIAVTWITSSLNAFARRTTDTARGSALFSLGGSVTALAVAVLAAGFSMHLFGLGAALLLLQGVIHDRLPGEPRPAGQILQAAGLILGVVASYLWLGSAGLAVGLGVLAVALQGLAGRSGRRWLDDAALASTALQVTVMIAVHPALHSGTPFASHLWSLLALATAAQLTWQWWTWRRDSAARSSVLSTLLALQALYVVAGLSTEVALLVPWLPALTLLWTGAAAALWLLGRASTGPRLVAVLCALAAVLKLLGLDWALLDGATRVALLLLVGTTMLVVPLVAPGAAPRRDNALPPVCPEG